MSRTRPSSARTWSAPWRVGLTTAPVDPQIAYLLGDERQSPHNSRTPTKSWTGSLTATSGCKEALTDRDVGRVIIKKRGFPQEPDDVRKQLKLRGSQEMIVVLARIGKGHEVFLCRLVQETAPALVQ